jgi:nitrile hydratase beta subunit
MNSIHDMGGMTGFGPVEPEPNEPVFHHDWESRVFAMGFATHGAFGPVDRIRHAIERMDPAEYLQTSYYEHWLVEIETLATELGMVSEEELASGVVKADTPLGTEAPDSEMIAAFVRSGMPATRDTGRQTPRFEVGQRVRARNIHPRGHTRLPRYVRGRIGIIEHIHGTHAFPDTAAHDLGDNPQPLYSVRFEATELWGSDHPQRDGVYVDLWEDYLEPTGSD